MWDFLKANPVVLGAVIAIVPILISNVIQIILHVIDIRQKNKEAKIQAREKWEERDILTTMDSVEKALTLLSEIKSLNRRIASFQGMKKTLHLDEDELKMEMKSNFEKASTLTDEANQALDIVGKLVYSFDEVEMVSRYDELVKATTTFFKSQDEHNRIIMREKAGRLQKALREKLISLRE